MRCSAIRTRDVSMISLVMRLLTEVLAEADSISPEWIWVTSLEIFLEISSEEDRDADRAMDRQKAPMFV